jgi:hypothetical protein
MSKEEFNKKFADERACQDHVFGLKWPSGFACAKCRGVRYYWHRRRALVECAGCKTQTYIRAQTLFEGSHLPLVKWFKAARLLATTDRSARDIQSELQLTSYGTAFTVLRRLRSCMRLPERRPILGPVELRAAVLGATDRSSKKAPVVAMVVGVERKEVRAGTLPNIGPAVVTAFMVANVRPGSKVYTASDAPEYGGLTAAGFQAVCVSKRLRRDGGAYSEMLDAEWNELEESTRGVRTDLAQHVQAFELRRYGRYLPCSLFETILRNAVEAVASEASTPQ